MPTDGSIDCHAHVVDPQRFAYVDGAGYRPQPHETGTREAFAAVLDAHDVTHALLVQPSCYGVDNAAMIDAMTRFPGRFKAIAVVSPDVTDRELTVLADRGVVGVRFNLVSYERHALAKAADVSVGNLSEIERGLAIPSIRTFCLLSTALGIGPGWLLEQSGPVQPNGDPYVVRATARQSIVFNKPGVVKRLASPPGPGNLQMLLVEIDPGSGSGEQGYSHAGEECGIVFEASSTSGSTARSARSAPATASASRARRPTASTTPATS
jgi:transcriptional regulator with XRE-family HTH domain